MEPAEGPVDRKLLARTISGELAPSVALEALDALDRLQGIERRQLRAAFAAPAEGAWWTAALDEQLWSLLSSTDRSLASDYQRERDRSPDGQCVRACALGAGPTCAPASVLRRP